MADVFENTERSQLTEAIEDAAYEPIEINGVVLKNIQAWRKQIWYWRTHLDVFIQEYFLIELKDTQRVIARAIGNGDHVA